MMPLESKHQPLVPGRPRKGLGWLRGHSAHRSRVPTLVWVLGLVAVTIGIATWGFHQLTIKPRLTWLQSSYRGVRIYTLDLGPAAGGSSARPNWQLWVALFLAAALVTRGAIALWRDRLRRTAMRHVLHNHVIVCGGGVHGTELVEALSGGRPADDPDAAQDEASGRTAHDVVLVDVDAHAIGMQAPRGKYEWRLVGDGVLERTLLTAGVAHASWVIAITGNDYLNSQIASTVHKLVSDGKARDRLYSLIQVEDPALARFLEEDTGLEDEPDQAAAARLPFVSPFSANTIAAEALIDAAQTQDGLPLLEPRGSAAPSILLAGDHPLIDALVLATLRRWHERILRSGDAPPLRISIFGPDAVIRLDRLQQYWRPVPAVATLEAQDAPLSDEGALEWLREEGRADHAFVVCMEELDGMRLTLGVSRALGPDIAMTRVTTEARSLLEERVAIHTEQNPYLASAKMVELAEVASDSDNLTDLDERQRLAKALGSSDTATALFEGRKLDIHSSSYWRLPECERQLLEPVLSPVPLGAFVRARLQVDMSPRSLQTIAAKLSLEEPLGRGFTAWCCYLSSLQGDEVPDDVLSAAVGPTQELLRLRASALRVNGRTEARVAIVAGGADGMSETTAEATRELLTQALLGYDGVLLSGGTSSGLPGIVGEVARQRGIRAVGYAPEGQGDPGIYPELRHTPGSTVFTVLEPLHMWRDIIAANISPQSVRLLAFPGGAITRQEVLLARAIGAEVAWIDPTSEVAETLDDQFPLGAGGVLELPVDAMTARAFLMSKPSGDETGLVESLAISSHNAYRRKQHKRKAPTDPAIAPWDTLVWSFKRSSLDQAADIPNKLALIGKQIAPPGGGEPLALSQDDIELLAEVEHGRWNVERLSSGWRLGDKRDVVRKLHTDLVPWRDLPEDIRDYDREHAANIPSALRAANLGVERRSAPSPDATESWFPRSSPSSVDVASV